MSETSFEKLGNEYKVDFDKWQVVDEAEKRILVQFRDKVSFVGFVRALLQSCENLTDELTKWARIRTVYEAEDENLNVLGRIVGAQRGRPLLDASLWFRTDDEDRTVDKATAWVPGVQDVIIPERTDIEYRYFIIAKAIRNHTQYGSVPEVTRLIKMLTGLSVSFIKTGPDEVAVVAIGANKNQVYILRQSESNNQYDDFWVPPYPAGLNIRGVITNADWLKTDSIDYCIDKTPAWTEGAIIIEL
jgi:hypothetical protein